MKAQKKATKCKDAVVDYKTGAMELVWKAGQRFDYAAIRKAATATADLTLKNVTITARGTVTANGTNGVFTVSGTGERFPLEDSSKGVMSRLLADAKPGTLFRVTGDIREDKKGVAAALIVSSFELDQTVK